MMKGILLTVPVLTALVFSSYIGMFRERDSVRIGVREPGIVKQDDFKASMARGKIAFETYCLACHQ